MRHTPFLALTATLLLTLSGCKAPTAATGKSSEAAEGPTMETAKGPRIYVSDEVSGDLTVIDATTMKKLETLHIGTRPRGIHASPDGKTLACVTCPHWRA